MTWRAAYFRDRLLNGIGLVALVWILWWAFDWLIVSAIGWGGDRASCLNATGACWPFWAEKWRLMLFGTYPFESHWRPMAASLILLTLVGVTGCQCARVIFRFSVSTLSVFWVLGCIVSVILMAGGIFGLSPVPTTRWNGLPVLLLLAILSLILALPLGIGLAVARVKSESAVIRIAAAVFVDGMRAIPMVSVLFVGIFVLPLVFPRQVNLDPMWSTLLVLIVFHAAYVAEDVRAGLESVPAGQSDAALALGLTRMQVIRHVVLPQALTQALPALLNTIIGAYKDTSLVLILGLFDLVATARMAFSDPLWQRQALEAYVLVGLWFFVSCRFLSWVGRRIDQSSVR